MNLRRVIPAAVFTLLIAAAPASAATQSAAAGPSATPLILEVGLAVLVGIALFVREPVTRALSAARKRVTSARPATPRASERARGV
jgi:hypothetical protein